MKANIRAIKSKSNDEGVSPVIAVILMVAITVVLAATVYVWVSGFASDDSGPEQASATARGMDLDDNGDVEWIRISLVRGENAPYSFSDVTIAGTDSSGAANSVVCLNATSASCSGNDLFDAGETWDVGETLWVPCTNSASGGNYAVTASVRGTTILDSTIKCEENA